ncbi:hypothetical protein AVEN_97922-1 [Araneus ventricosus]|uniref:Uncharacterized protein n=1 Tax=Araneus ventricosus TaxID=182803 RepID=A0A4Y2JD48_ARAVE|nr:hypothetical protein AVEN_97922-1 [Araneus ventricosus]
MAPTPQLWLQQTTNPVVSSGQTLTLASSLLPSHSYHVRCETLVWNFWSNNKDALFRVPAAPPPPVLFSQNALASTQALRIVGERKTKLFESTSDSGN